VGSEIFNAVRNTVPPNPLDRDAVAARIEIDLRIGAAFTRFQTLRFQNRFAGLSDSILSYGPCQFPTLGLSHQHTTHTTPRHSL
jgi:DNA topoisomerase-3